MKNTYNIKMINYLKRILKGKSLLDQLKENGLKVGKNFFMNTGCKIDFSHCWLIKIGDNVTLASNVIILAHDASTKRSLDYTKIALVEIGDNVFIGAGSIILPGVSIGNNVIIGAGSIVTKDVPDDSIAVGNPAKTIGKSSEYISRSKSLMKIENCFSESYTLRGNITEDKKSKMRNVLNKFKNGFVK